MIAIKIVHEKIVELNASNVSSIFLKTNDNKKHFASTYFA